MTKYKIIYMLAFCLASGAISTASFAASGGTRDRLKTDKCYTAGGEETSCEAANKKAEPVIAKYPNATRIEPPFPKTKIKKDWDALVKATNAKDSAATIASAQVIMASPDASLNEKAESANQIAQAYLSTDKTSYLKPIDYGKQAIELNGLSNNAHYQLMLALSQMMVAEKLYADALIYVNRFSKETGIDDLSVNKVRGNALYRQQKYAEAVVSLKKVYDLDKDSDPTAATMLMDAYQRSGQKAEADKIANDIGKSAESADPNDKNAKVKQLLVLANAKQYDKAAKVFDELYAKGQITQPNEYEAGYVSYSYLEGKEDQSVKIINEGIAKGIIEPDAQVYNILAQSSYYSNQPKLAIDAWTKGAALSKDGEQNLSLARVYIEEERYSEGKAAAQQALSKGIKDRGEAKQLIAEADAALGH